jgi:glycosyltransferase involved in cell wall biosynthesis
MNTRPYSRLMMFGAAPQTPGSIATVVDAYRAHGLFTRWPIEYVPTHYQGSAGQNAACALRALRSFAAGLARERRLVVHLHTAARGFWRDSVIMAAALAARCPLVLQLHAGGFERRFDAAGPFLRTMMRTFIEHASCVIVPSESMRSWVRGIARNAYVVCLPNPVASTQASRDPGCPNLVLFLGRLKPGKGVFDLVDAVSELRAAVPDVRLVCAGDGDRGAVARYAERLGIADAVKFTGWVGSSGKRALLESAAVFALPSYEEALPMSLLEAMGAGLPVIASPVGGIPEVVVDGVSGFLCAPGDRASLQRALRKLLLDRSLAARIGAAARESVRLRFAPERALPRLEQVYAAVGLCGLAEARSPLRDIGMKGAA